MNTEFYKPSSRAITCTNCGKSGHYNKSCRDPPTSYGIILVKICDINAENGVLNKMPNRVVNTIDNVGDIDMDASINVKSKSAFSRIGESIDSIRFLMVSRKHSLGYCEFVRGRYRVESFKGIHYLFRQMMQHEIDNIKTKTFDDLWYEFWGIDDKRSYGKTRRIDFSAQYLESKEKYDMLCRSDAQYLPLNTFTNNTVPEYSIPEWGFPKGRKKIFETDVECAIRETCEETGLEKSDFVILTGIDPIVENMTGTDGKKYRHIYYVAEMVSDRIPSADDPMASSEIGNVQFFNYEDAIRVIRDYHEEKKRILTGVFTQFMNKILNPTESFLMESTQAITNIQDINVSASEINTATDLQGVVPKKQPIVYEWILDDDDVADMSGIINTISQIS